MKQFEFRKGTGWPIDAQTAGERLEHLEQKHGKITPAMVVKDKVFKPCFKPYQDDTKAARLFREQVARRLIGSIVTVNIIETDNKPIRTFVNVRTQDNDHVDQGYISIDVALKDSDFRIQVLQEAHTDMKRFIEKYKSFKELADYITGVKQITIDMEAELNN